MPIISLSGIEKVYRTKEIETTALENVNLDVNQGEFVSIMGPSGCGKSTLLNIIGLLDKPTKGTVSLLGQSCDGLSDRQLSHFRNANLGFVFQSFHLIPSLDVAANVELPLIYRSGLSAHQKFMDEIVHMLALEDKLQNMPNNLSGGQQQRVAIARALITKPAIVLADEPTGNLDSKTSADVLGLLKRTSTQFNQTIVMITHNNEIAQLADRIVRIEDGKIVG